MKKVVKISFQNSNKLYYFSTNDINISKNDLVIVESERGFQFGTVASDVIEIDESKIPKTLKNIIRKATDSDFSTNRKNIIDSEKALKKAKELAKKLNVNMTLLNAYFTFDRNQLVFNFIADDRVDFRELAKNLASIYKTRIELRQIGVRDKAKEVGGIGPCGRFLCCNLFLNDFESVSINMAKNQYISLKPNKINGICGRLLCCLNYEDDQYTELKKQFPSIGTIIKYNGIRSKVVGHDLFKKMVTLEKEDKSLINISLKEYESCK